MPHDRNYDRTFNIKDKYIFSGINISIHIIKRTLHPHMLLESYTPHDIRYFRS